MRAMENGGNRLLERAAEMAGSVSELAAYLKSTETLLRLYMDG